MASLDVPRIIRRVRQRMGLSQEGLARRLDATKGAVQHWERARNEPDLARLFALRTICPPGTERREVDGLIRQVQGRTAGSSSPDHLPARKSRPLASGAASQMLERENKRLRQRIDKLQSSIERRTEQLRILENVATELQRQVAELKASKVRGPADGAEAAAVE